jgi:Trk K+ transport system NAD-binding subunit
VICGGGRFARELSADLRAEGVEVTVVEALDPEARLDDAVAFVAATEDDMTNLWLLERVRRLDDRLFLVVLQNRAGNAPLFKAADVDFGMMPAELIVHEVLARLANPELMRFLPEVPHMGDAWAEEMVERLSRCGPGAPDLWSMPLTEADAPALLPWLPGGTLRLDDLLRDPRLREERLDIVPLALLRGDDTVVAPDPGTELHLGDVLLVAAGASQRRIIDATLSHPPTAAYVVEGRRVPSAWIWRLFTHDRS